MKEVKKIPSSIYVSRFLAAALLFIVTAGVVAVITSSKEKSAVGVASNVRDTARIIVFDPGHGGEDPGASSESGVNEKDLNLEISLLCSTIIKAAGYDVRSTRTDDRMVYDIYDDLEDYEGQKKLYDLKNRIRFADECAADLFVSIHMNKFFRPQYRGLQVYYSTNDPSSERYAAEVQTTVQKYLDPDNNREIKKATSSIYLLKNIQRSAILVECGFLSSPIDLKNLTDPKYDLDLSTAICAAIINSFQTSKEPANQVAGSILSITGKS